MTGEKRSCSLGYQDPRDKIGPSPRIIIYRNFLSRHSGKVPEPRCNVDASSPVPTPRAKSARTHMELVSFAPTGRKKAPLGVNRAGRVGVVRLENKFVLLRSILVSKINLVWNFVSLAYCRPIKGLLHRIKLSDNFPEYGIGTPDYVNNHFVTLP